jgi:L-amino acid N-acyltransferase YncA
MENAVIRAATAADAEALASIYNHYILNTVITFEEQAITAADMTERLAEVAASKLPWLVAERAGQVLGFAYASKWKGRCAYRYAAEVTVYLDATVPRQGFGTQLYEALFAQLRERGMHTLIGGIAEPNPASVALHEKFGMRKVAHFAQVGFKFGRWVDVGYWQVMLSLR